MPLPSYRRLAARSRDLWNLVVTAIAVRDEEAVKALQEFLRALALPAAPVVEDPYRPVRPPGGGVYPHPGFRGWAFALLSRIGYVINGVTDIPDLPLVESAPIQLISSYVLLASSSWGAYSLCLCIMGWFQTFPLLTEKHNAFVQSIYQVPYAELQIPTHIPSNTPLFFDQI